MYNHTQTGWTIIAVFACAMACILYVKINMLALGISVGVVFLFHSLKVAEYDSFFQIAFGPGLIRKKFYFNEIESVSIVRNQWWEGFGIRKIVGGWLFNVSGLNAVKLTMKNGKIYKIGTDEPERLAIMLYNKIGKKI